MSHVGVYKLYNHFQLRKLVLANEDTKLEKLRVAGSCFSKRTIPVLPYENKNFENKNNEMFAKSEQISSNIGCSSVREGKCKIILL